MKMGEENERRVNLVKDLDIRLAGDWSGALSTAHADNFILTLLIVLLRHCTSLLVFWSEMFKINANPFNRLFLSPVPDT